MRIMMLFSLVLFGSVYLSAQANEGTVFTTTEAAVHFAEENDARILMVFAGSDWCRPCMKFKKEVLEDKQFRTLSQPKVAVLYLDFPAKKKNKLSEAATAHNEDLAEKYNTSGTFPAIFLMDKSMSLIREINYDGQSCDEFVSSL